MLGFDLDAYRALLRQFKAAGYFVALFSEVYHLLQQSRPFVVLRHDIEISLEAAQQVAQVEHEEGVRATYFTFLRSPLYNSLDESNTQIIHELHQMGHDIALHAQLQPEDVTCLGPAREVEALASYFPFADRDIVSVHSPTSLQSLPRSFAPIERVYGPILSGQVAYLSDSMGRWRSTDPLSSEAFHNHRPIQLLTHPLWWAQSGQTSQEKIERWLDESCSRRRATAKTVYPKLYGSIPLE